MSLQQLEKVTYSNYVTYTKKASNCVQEKSCEHCEDNEIATGRIRLEKLNYKVGYFLREKLAAIRATGK